MLYTYCIFCGNKKGYTKCWVTVIIEIYKSQSNILAADMVTETGTQWSTKTKANFRREL